MTSVKGGDYCLTVLLPGGGEQATDAMNGEINEPEAKDDAVAAAKTENGNQKDDEGRLTLGGGGGGYSEYPPWETDSVEQCLRYLCGKLLTLKMWGKKCMNFSSQNAENLIITQDCVAHKLSFKG